MKNFTFLLVLIVCLLTFVKQSFSETTKNTDIVKTFDVELTGNIASFQIQKLTQLHINDSHTFSVPKSKNFRNKCVGVNQYFKANGELGKKGLILKRELTSSAGARSTPMKHLFFRNTFPKMNKLCPKFNSFNDSEKLNFWIWYFAAKAHTESECGRNAYNPRDPNGVSIGELQMPDSWKNRKWRGLTGGAGGCEATPPPVRPPSYTHKKPPASLMAGTDNNLSCGVEVLAGVLCGFYTSPAESCNGTTRAPYGHGFWRKLKDGLKGPIVRDIKEFPLCN